MEVIFTVLVANSCIILNKLYRRFCSFLWDLGRGFNCYCYFYDSVQTLVGMGVGAFVCRWSRVDEKS